MKNKNKYCFSISSIYQAKQIISFCKNNKIKPIFLIKYYLVAGLGPDWLIELRNLLIKDFKKNNFKFCVECKKNYGLFILLVQKKIDFLMVSGNNEILKKLNQISKKNKISINPKFDMIEGTNLKKMKSMIGIKEKNNE